MKLKDLMEKYGEYEVVLSKREATNEIMIEGRKPKPKTVWDLTVGDTQYNINPHGIVVPLLWDGGFGDTSRRDFGSVFLTKEEAEQALERRKVEALLLKHGGRRWFKEDTPNYFIRVHENGLWLTSDWTNHSPIQGTIYFDTKKQAEKAISEIGEDRIKKALFEVR